MGGEFTCMWNKKFLQSTDKKTWMKEAILNTLTPLGAWYRIERDFNPLQMKSRLLYLKPQAYRAVKTFHLGYKNQSVYDVIGIGRCLSHVNTKQ